MRSFAAGLALFMAFLTGTATLGAYVAHQVVLDPDRAGQALSAALDEPDLLHKVLNQTVPGYQRLSQTDRDLIDGLAGSDTAHRAVGSVSMDARGDVDLAPLRRQITRALRSAGQPGLADQLAAAAGGTRVSVPSDYFSHYQRARDVSWFVATRGAVATLVLFAVALLVSPHRVRTVRSVGVALLLSTAVAALAFWALPALAAAVSSSTAADAAAVVLRAERSDVLRALLPPAVVAVVLIVVGLVGQSLGRTSRRSPRSATV
ncbi:MAG: hypothetical protein ABI776_09435 [Nocardioidaceae bacterium]